MSEQDPYRALARRLDQIPNGYPATESGVELRILERLFRPEEATLAAHLRLTPEPSAAIAARLGRAPTEVHRLLKGMAKRGLIHVERRPGGLTFGLMPFVVGFYERQAGRLDAELAALMEEYILAAYPRFLGLEPALHRVIPVEEAVPTGIEILPYESASALLDRASAWGVVDCICREQQRLLGKGCNRPLDVCLVMSATPGAFDQSTGVRALTRAGADQVLRRAAAAGLVHSTSNTQSGIWYICNCCTCCCGILRGIAGLGIRNALAHSAFRVQVDENACRGCGACGERCPFGALALVDDVARVDGDRCAGCGLCVSSCPSDALSLRRRAKEESTPVPENMEAWWQERARRRGIEIADIE